MFLKQQLSEFIHSQWIIFVQNGKFNDPEHKYLTTGQINKNEEMKRNAIRHQELTEKKKKKKTVFDHK